VSETKGTWEFFGFESKAEGRPVQAWYNRLRVEAKEEITDLVEHLRVRVASQWGWPDFDPLDGEGGISELRPANIHCEEGSLTYRIYGVRGYPGKWSYTFLHGVRKEERNDMEGKEFAKWRLRQLGEEEIKRGGPAIHKFDFEGEPNSETGARAGSEG
jgi:hypothetical protein